MNTPQVPKPRITSAAGLSKFAQPKRSVDTPPLKPAPIQKTNPMSANTPHSVNVTGHGPVDNKALDAYMPHLMDLQEFTRPMEAMHEFRHEANQGGSATEQLYSALRNG